MYLAGISKMIINSCCLCITWLSYLNEKKGIVYRHVARRTDFSVPKAIHRAPVVLPERVTQFSGTTIIHGIEWQAQQRLCYARTTHGRCYRHSSITASGHTWQITHPSTNQARCRLTRSLGRYQGPALTLWALLYIQYDPKWPLTSNSLSPVWNDAIITIELPWQIPNYSRNCHLNGIL